MQIEGLRLLVIDGGQQLVSDIRRCLEALGATTEGATSAQEGFEAVSRNRPDLVVMAIDLPGGGGPALHQHLHDIGEALIPVIYISEPEESRLRRDAMRLGAAAFVDRPVDLQSLVAVIHRVLGTTVPKRASEARKILIVEDEPDQRELIEQCLSVVGREPVHMTFADSATEARKLITDGSYECLLIDHHLPECTGLELIESMEERLLTTPVIGMSSSVSPRVAIEYFRAGCVEFFLKPDVLAADRLRRGIANAMSKFHRRAMATIIERRQLGDAIVQSQEQMISLARTDHLMGICNRAVFDDLHPQYHEEAVKQGKRYALCMIDVDHFKLYNDRYGHSAGDDALRKVADAISGALREHDFVARYGGEELVVLLDDLDGETVTPVVQRLLECISSLDIEHLDAPRHRKLTASIGACLFQPQEPISARRVLLHADAALYQAKRQGRNRIIVSEGEPVEETEKLVRS